jgi:hypothetical protein
MHTNADLEQSRILLAREIVGRAFSHREAQDLPVNDLLELAALLSAETLERDRSEDCRPPVAGEGGR